MRNPFIMKGDMSRGIAKRVLAEFRKNDSQDASFEPYGLTRRELEILDHLARGLTTRKAAGTLCISYETIRSHQTYTASFGKLSAGGSGCLQGTEVRR